MHLEMDNKLKIGEITLCNKKLEATSTGDKWKRIGGDGFDWQQWYGCTN